MTMRVTRTPHHIEVPVAPTETGCRVDAALTVRVKSHLRVLEPVLWFAFRKGLRGDLARLAGILARRSYRQGAVAEQG